jgi:hypothetical protein
MVRESLVSHGDREYRTRWYLCPDCGDVSFSYEALGCNALSTLPASLGAHTTSDDVRASEESVLTV